MNQLVQELISPFLIEGKIQKGIALVPGKYKPPHKGHLYVIQQLSKDPKVKDIIILISPRTVEGITPEVSKEIWEKYLQKYGIKAKILLSNEPSPVKASVNIIKNNPDNFYYVVTGYRTEEDLKDLARGNFTAKYGNADTIVVEGEDIRATRIRQYLADRDYSAFSLNLPDRLTNAEKKQIYNRLIEVVPASINETQLDSKEQFSVNDMIKVSKGAKLYDKKTGKRITLKQSKIYKVISNNNSKFNLEDSKGNKFWVMDYEIKNNPEAWVLIDNNINESKDPYGVKAYTLELAKLREEKPNKKLNEVKLKDLITKLKVGWGDFVKAIKQEGKETQEAFILLNQAAQGKITLTPEQKKQIGNQMKDVLKTLGYVTIFALPGGSIVTILLKVLNLNKYVLPSSFLTEGKYDFEVTSQTRYIINQLKNNLGEKYTETIEGQVKGIDYDLIYNFIPNDEGGFDYEVYGDTTEGDEDELDTIVLNIEYNINSIPNSLNGLIASIKNTLRHELEHIAQFNIQGKVEPGDEDQEDLYIVDYLTSPDEVEAFVQGLYKQAKTQKLPLSKVIEDYLNQNIDDFETKEDYDKVYNTWINWAKNNLPKAQLQESASLAWNPKKSLVTLSKYLMNELDIKETPNIEIKEDEENAKDILGKTAYYNPSTYTITLYITGRHPKDILRSFSHEMIHHKQNLDGRLGNITTTNTNEDDELTEIEREAYELGNILFRNWEDKIKND